MPRLPALITSGDVLPGGGDRMVVVGQGISCSVLGPVLLAIVRWRWLTLIRSPCSGCSLGFRSLVFKA